MQVNTALNTLAKTVKSVRINREISVASLAKKNGNVSESTIRRIERASKTGYNPKLSTLVKLANGLKIPLAQLVLHFQANGNNVVAKK
jgi:transcriptional regulator with XRE-family HTH domain